MFVLFKVVSLVRICMVSYSKYVNMGVNILTAVCFFHEIWGINFHLKIKTNISWKSSFTIYTELWSQGAHFE